MKQADWLSAVLGGRRPGSLEAFEGAVMRLFSLAFLLLAFSGIALAESPTDSGVADELEIITPDGEIDPDAEVGIDLSGVLERMDAVMDAVERLEGYVKLCALSLCLLCGGLLADAVWLWVCGRRALR